MCKQWKWSKKTCFLVLQGQTPRLHKTFYLISKLRYIKQKPYNYSWTSKWHTNNCFMVKTNNIIKVLSTSVLWKLLFSHNFESFNFNSINDRNDKLTLIDSAYTLHIRIIGVIELQVIGRLFNRERPWEQIPYLPFS